MNYGKIEGKQIVLTDSTKVVYIDGVLQRVEKSAQDLAGYKPVFYGEVPFLSIYEDLHVSYQESDTQIDVVYTPQKKSQENIVEINTRFWNEQYFQVLSLMPQELFAPYTSYLNGQPHDLLKDDYSVLILGASAGQLSYLDLYAKPDFTKELSQEYLATLKVQITDTAQMTAVLGFFWLA